MSSRSAPPTPLAQVLEDMLERKGLGSKLAQYAMFEDWEKIVGKPLAEKTQPIKMQGNQLVIGVEHPTWIPELQFMKPKILQKIREIFPETTISDLRFVLKN
jgi:predicted nucleic acid-binding Zn ribbon protein